MNFFEQQDRARKKTTLLVVLFVLSVISIVLAVDAAVVGIARFTSGARAVRHNSEWEPYPSNVDERAPVSATSLVLCSTAVTLLIVLGGSAYKTASLSGGGPSVAQLLGGRPLNTAAPDNDEAKLKNIVEEMAIASGVPVPRIYVLDQEDGINAFAAGYTTSDAVIGVTRGAMTKLNRDELQGVIAHEFSHILNGDMKLNLRLIGMLSGIFVVSLIGSIIVRMLPYAPAPSRMDDRENNERGGGLVIALLVFGFCLYAIGSIGVFFGRLIQAAVSRQREYLADASAVQFTRNPAGIVNALKKLGKYSSGARVQNPHTLETAHMFFANTGFSFADLLATHPSLEARIRAIDPTFDGKFDYVSPANLTEKYGGGAVALSPQRRVPLPAGRVVDDTGRITPQQISLAADLMATLPAPLTTAAAEPFSVRAVIFAVLLNQEPPIRQKQLELVKKSVEPQCYAELLKLTDMTDALSEGARLPLLDLCLPALRLLSPVQANAFRTIMRQMIQADGQVTLFEYALNRLVEKQLVTAGVIKREPMAYFAVGAVRDEAAVILSALAAASTADTPRAFETGARQLDPDRPMQLIQVNGLQPIEAALRKLAQCSPAVKQRLISAFAATITADAQVNVAEAELLRAVAATMDVPIPPMMAGQ